MHLTLFSLTQTYPHINTHADVQLKLQDARERAEESERELDFLRSSIQTTREQLHKTGLKLWISEIQIFRKILYGIRLGISISESSDM